MLSCNKEKGCTNVNACNFIATADIDDGSCYSPGDSCDDGNSDTESDVYDNDCNCSGVDIPDSGCTDSSACNFNPDAEIQVEGSCFYEGDDCNDNDPSTINDIYNEDCLCEGEISSEGCMDSNACTYNPLATVNDPSSCEYVNDPCNDFNPNTINDVWSSNCDCEGEVLNIDCMDTNACNYNPYANSPDNNMCVYPGDSCDDGNPNTINDVYNDNCNCQGTTTATGDCIVEPEGSEFPGAVGVTFGVFADDYSDECQFRIHLTGDETITTDWIPATVNNSLNEDTWYFTGPDWTMQVEDSYGDGKGPNGYYYATCVGVNNQTVTLVNTPFTEGYTSSTSFSIGTGFTGPSSVTDNN